MPPTSVFLQTLWQVVFWNHHTNANINNPHDPAFPLIPYVKKYEVILDEGGWDFGYLPTFGTM